LFIIKELYCLGHILLKSAFYPEFQCKTADFDESYLSSQRHETNSK